MQYVVCNVYIHNLVNALRNAKYINRVLRLFVVGCIRLEDCCDSFCDLYYPNCISLVNVKQIEQKWSIESIVIIEIAGIIHRS